jgi:hydroxymethylpyrimidine/phosphomethylpyrimidine kinase
LTDPTDLLAESQPNSDLSFRRYPGERIVAGNTHGTGCAFSTSVACNLALGSTLSEAVLNAKKYVTEALRNSYQLGRGTGPINHLFGLKRS